MPQYDYACTDCDHHFTVVLTLSEHEHEQETVKCPKCGSHKVEQLVSSFFAVTSKKS